MIFLRQKLIFITKKNYRKELIILDPGIGFGKNLDHNLRLMSKISIFHSLGCPILIGTSRKRFIEHIVTKFDTPDRTEAHWHQCFMDFLKEFSYSEFTMLKKLIKGY